MTPSEFLKDTTIQTTVAVLSAVAVGLAYWLLRGRPSHTVRIGEYVFTKGQARHYAGSWVAVNRETGDILSLPGGAIIYASLDAPIEAVWFPPTETIQRD